LSFLSGCGQAFASRDGIYFAKALQREGGFFRIFAALRWRKMSNGIRLGPNGFGGRGRIRRLF